MSSRGGGRDFPRAGRRKPRPTEPYSPSHQSDLDRAKMASKKRPEVTRDDEEVDVERAERVKKKWNRVPIHQYPQFVWLINDPCAGEDDIEYEEDGTTRKRGMIFYELMEERYKEMKRLAPDLELCTLYYVSDDLEHPEIGRDLIFLNERVLDARLDGVAFHKRYDIIRPGVHSDKLISAVRDFRVEMDSQRNQSYGIEEDNVQSD